MDPHRLGPWLCLYATRGHVMKRLWPKSLWGQTLASTALILGLAQILSIILFSLLILRPELRRVAQVTAQSVATVSQTMADVSPAERAHLMQNMAKSPWLELWTGTTPPDDRGPPPRAIERVFMRALVAAMGDKTDLTWRTDHDRKLWIHVYLGPDPYWISIRSKPIMGPTGLVFVSGLVSVALALIVAWNLNAKLMRPLNELRTATERYTPSGDHVRLSEDGPTEIADLSHSFNVMTERLAKAEADRTLILAGISHDVRTPLAKLKLAFEMMGGEDDLRISAQRQIDSIDRILSSFMTFARGFEAEPIGLLDPHLLLDEMVQTYGAHAVVLAGDMRLWDNEPPMIPCRPEAVRRAFVNLIENAIRYGQNPVEKGPIEIAIRQDGGVWALIVRDHGDGVPEAQIATLTEPFVRGDQARQPNINDPVQSSGTGLGLAIVKHIVERHRGRLDISSRLGIGTTVTIRLGIVAASPLPGLAAQPDRATA
eukprot:gene8267-10592_t